MQCLSWVRSTNVPQKRYLFWDSIFWGTEGTSKNYLVPKVPQKIIYSAKGTTNNFLLPSTTVPEKILFLEVCVQMGKKNIFSCVQLATNCNLRENNLKGKCHPARKKFEEGKCDPTRKKFEQKMRPRVKKIWEEKCDPARKKFEGKIALFLKYVWNCRDKHCKTLFTFFEFYVFGFQFVHLINGVS